MKTKVLAVLLLALCLPLSLFAEKPNIVFILADDLGWRDTGVYGSTYYRTPNIDRLALQGMRFTDAYAASPLCSPTRASIMTGEYPARIGMTAAQGHDVAVVLKATIAKTASPLNKAVTPETATRLDTDYFTIAEALKDAGYRTAHFGKWHLGSGKYMAKYQGFDVTVGGGGEPCPNSYHSPYKMDTIPDGPPGEHIDRRMTEEAIRFMRDNKSGPFYVNLWLYDVHGPFQSDGDLIRKYEGLRDEKNPQNFPTMAAMVETMDSCVGKVLEALKEMGLEQNTLVIFTSDNGGLVDKDNYYSKEPPTSNLPLRGGKGSIYEGGTRVPLVMRWPGKIPADSVSHALVSSVDFYPTLLAAAGTPRREGQILDGIDLLPLTKGAEPDPTRNIFSIFPHYLHYVDGRYEVEPGASVRQGDYKLLRFFARGDGGKDDLELYDLKGDIGETTNLATSMPEKTGEMNALLDKILKESGACVPFRNVDYDPHVRMKQVGNTYITYSQQQTPYVFLFNRFPTSLLKGNARISLVRPGRGRISWSTENSKLTEHSVEFSQKDFGPDGSAVVAFGDGQSKIKDIRVDLYGAEDGAFQKVSIADDSGKETVAVDLKTP